MLCIFHMVVMGMTLPGSQFVKFTAQSRPARSTHLNMGCGFAGTSVHGEGFTVVHPSQMPTDGICTLPRFWKSIHADSFVAAPAPPVPKTSERRAWSPRAFVLATSALSTNTDIAQLLSMLQASASLLKDKAAVQNLLSTTAVGEARAVLSKAKWRVERSVS